MPASPFQNSSHLYSTKEEQGLYPLLSVFSIEDQIKILQEILGEARTTRLTTAFAHKLSGLQIAAEHPQDPHNAAAFVRSAEALGMAHVHAISKLPTIFHTKSTTQGAYHWMFAHYYSTTQELFEHCRKNNMQIFACDMQGSCSLHDIVLEKKTCLLFGNEREGLSDFALQNADKTVKIPMYGLSESLNLSVSAAISLHHFSTQLRVAAKKWQQLSTEEYTLLNARALLKSRDVRFLHTFLKKHTTKKA